ncbi:MAG: hypothetical protein ACRD68_09480, partial [Pyrinomonadaceae bacterium]
TRSIPFLIFGGVALAAGGGAEALPAAHVPRTLSQKHARSTAFVSSARTPLRNSSNAGNPPLMMPGKPLDEQKTVRKIPSKFFSSSGS